MVQSPKWRILCGVLFFFSILFLPLWASAVFGTACLFLFRLYYEYIALFFLADLLYAVPEARYHHFVFVMTAGAIIIFFIAERLKKRMAVYRSHESAHTFL